MIFRKTTPKRSTEVPHHSNYRDYRPFLREDFGKRCGYCNDYDTFRIDRYEIDHFVPVTLDKDRKTDYSNLVYACKSCNNSKSDTWPTGDTGNPNDGKIGWIDPCSKEYAMQFERDEYGAIIPKTDMGEWMFENLKLWKAQHSYLWCIEHIGEQLENIEEHYQETDNPHILKKIIKINKFYDDLIKRLSEL